MSLRYFSRFYFQRAEGEALAEDVGGGRRLFRRAALQLPDDGPAAEGLRVGGRTRPPRGAPPLARIRAETAGSIWGSVEAPLQRSAVTAVSSHNSCSVSRMFAIPVAPRDIAQKKAIVSEADLREAGAKLSASAQAR